jgi:hypothetical protein
VRVTVFVLVGAIVSSLYACRSPLQKCHDAAVVVAWTHPTQQCTIENADENEQLLSYATSQFGAAYLQAAIVAMTSPGAYQLEEDIT